jgi:hypothetical protein
MGENINEFHQLQQKYAFNIGMSALVAHNIYNFGENFSKIIIKKVI